MVNSQERIDQEWKDALKCLSLPIEMEWEPELVKWRNCYAEISAYAGPADLAWLRKSQASLSALEGVLPKYGRENFEALAIAVENHVKSGAVNDIGGVRWASRTGLPGLLGPWA